VRKGRSEEESSCLEGQGGPVIGNVD